MEIEMNVQLDTGAFLPEKSHKEDAGFDIRCRENVDVKSGKSAIIDTGVHIAIPEGWCGLLTSKSGLNVKHGLTGRGLIDSGYTGSIVVKLDNFSEEDYTFHLGDKIIQIIFLPVPEVKFNITDSISSNSERGSNGFGSTGK